MSKVEKPCVLVVDDNVATSTLITALLQPHFTVELAAGGSEAIEKLRTKQYAVTLLDLRMPDHDGFEVLEFLKTTRPEALRSVIVVTALLMKNEVARVRAYDVAGVIAKPFEVETLLNAVKRCAGIGGSGLSRVLCAPTVLMLADLLQRKLL